MLAQAHTTRGEVICRVDVQALGLLLGSRRAVVLDMTVGERAIKGVEVQKRRDIRVCGRTMIAFVKIVGEDLPIVGPRNRVSVIKHVVGEIITFVAGLDVNGGEMRFPRHSRRVLS